jgi:hypothetical protein
VVIAFVVVSACATSACGGDVDVTPYPTSCPAPHPPVVTTVQEIMAGKFKTAIDKEGTCGTYVTVRHLKVLRIVPMDDGDWHVEVTDGKIPVFITEVIPRDQKREGEPPVGAYIDETGTAYDDLAADGENHQWTTWEIHPVTAWTLS